jgi:hypothetical protein
MTNLEKYKDPNNIYKDIWDKNEDTSKLPYFYRKIIEIDFKEFEEKVYSNNKIFSENLVHSLLAGDVYLLKKSFPPEYLQKIKKETVKNWKTKKSEFFKIRENCPNFYRNITEELSGKYAFKQVKQTQYFFPWNDDFCNLYHQTYKRWRVIKYLSGFYKDVWEKDTPRDGIVDRIQIVKYPPKSGLLELHQDPYVYQKFFISVYLTKKGEDYEEGGMYFIDKKKNKFLFEDLVDVGDMSFGFGTIYHGVDVSNTIANNPESDVDGRWFMGLYTTVSDYVKNRHTGKPANNLK